MCKSLIQKAIDAAGSQEALAAKTGFTQAAISKLLRGKSRRPSAEMAIAIDRATEGQVKKSDLRPDLFGEIAA